MLLLKRGNLIQLGVLYDKEYVSNIMKINMGFGYLKVIFKSWNLYEHIRFKGIDVQWHMESKLKGLNNNNQL